MFFLRCRRGGDLRLLSRILTSGKEHNPCRHFGEHRPGGADPYNKEITASKTVLKRLTNLLFYTISEGQDQLPVNKFINTLKSNGLLTSDPRLKDCMDILHETVQDSIVGATMDLEVFQKCVQSNIVLLTQIVCRKFVIPDFEQFTLHINRLYENALTIREGEVANYIPQLAKVSSDKWGVSLCTVDGQRLVRSLSVLTNMSYKCRQCERGLTKEHLKNTIRHGLDLKNKPYNPMVNAGAIVVSSLIKQGSNKAEKFDYVMQFLKRMSGNEYVGFNNSTFQSERETGDRNYAIGYYLKEKKCFPTNADMGVALDLYFQLCSIEVTCESGSVIAATLANGGICPITGDRVLSAEAVRNTLSLMHSCGMYDFSGQFAFHVGLPAKSGVSGAILLVVPNIMGVFCWSPLLDRIGNSVRGIHFCQELVSVFNFHNYDNLRHCARKLDPRKERREVQHKTVVNLLFAAYSGDVSALRRFALSSMDMEQKDYDSRTALHVAAAEGHSEVVRFLIQGCRVNPFMEDRWGNTPLEDAIRFQQHDVVNLLTEYQESYARSQKITEKEQDQMSLENLESMV
ncbi:PREDICTED: glutaminase liver isoform, mitochondrial [Nanorana parkeri]|uniref:glutaminase liver isoform, mitochondrial n=1 Tax=Nanorana parkeri TaxID=125878 RepID=UPI00085419AE|nr:PREDICTED: glutaminase liver isoform, mitochondrial [Nanorana parkeri]